MKVLAVTSAIIGIALTAPAFAFGNPFHQSQIDKAAGAPEASKKGGPEGRPGAVQAREGTAGAPCDPRTYSQAQVRERLQGRPPVLERC